MLFHVGTKTAMTANSTYFARLQIGLRCWVHDKKGREAEGKGHIRQCHFEFLCDGKTTEHISCKQHAVFEHLDQSEA